MPTYQQLVQGKVPEPFWQLRNMKRAGYTYCGYVGFSELLIEQFTPKFLNFKLVYQNYLQHNCNLRHVKKVLLIFLAISL